MEEKIKKYFEYQKRRNHTHKSFREKKIKENSNCYYCGCTIYLYNNLNLKQLKKGQRFPDDLATVEHLYDRFDPRRYEIYENDEDKVLACWKCNSERAKQKVKKIPQPLMIERARLSKLYKKFNPGQPRVFGLIENTKKIAEAIENN